MGNLIHRVELNRSFRKRSGGLAYQVVGFGFCDFYADKLSYFRFLTWVVEGDYDFAVDFGGFAVGAAVPELLVVGDAFDEDGEGAAYLLFLLLPADVSLYFHEAGEAAFDVGVVDLVGKGFGGGTFFGGVSECAEAFELEFFDAFGEGFEGFGGFAGEADDHGGAQDDVGHGGAQCGEAFSQGGVAGGAAHGFEDGGVEVLEGDVDVVADFRLTGDELDQVVGEAGGVEVEEADPEVAGYVAESGEEVAEVGVVVEVGAVGGDVLGDEVDFFGSGGDEGLGFVDEQVGGDAGVGAFHGGYGAEGACVVAAVGDFEVGGWEGVESFSRL